MATAIAAQKYLPKLFLQTMLRSRTMSLLRVVGDGLSHTSILQPSFAHRPPTMCLLIKNLSTVFTARFNKKGLVYSGPLICPRWTFSLKEVDESLSVWHGAILEYLWVCLLKGFYIFLHGAINILLCEKHEPPFWKWKSPIPNRKNTLS